MVQFFTGSSICQYQQLLPKFVHFSIKGSSGLLGEHQPGSLLSETNKQRVCRLIYFSAFSVLTSSLLLSIPSDPKSGSSPRKLLILSVTSVRTWGIKLLKSVSDISPVRILYLALPSPLPLVITGASIIWSLLGFSGGDLACSHEQFPLQAF